MKKKVLSILLCAAMSATLLTACGSKETGTQGGASGESTAQTAENSSGAGGEATPEEVPAAFAHYTFDGDAEGYTAVVQTDDVGANDGASFGIAPTDVEFVYADGPVGKALYLDGSYGLDLNLEATKTDSYTVSFWVNAARLATFGPTLQIGYNIGRAADAGNNVTWMNVTQSEWGADSAKIFPIVWSRNEASDAQDGTDCWPWMYGWDDSIHGKREWAMVTVVCSGEKQDSPLGSTTAGAQLYINGELVYDSQANYTNNTYFEYTWDATLAPNIMQPGDSEFESYFGINYWDTVFKGFVDDLYVFDSALSAGQVASLYALGDPTVESVAPEGEAEAEPETPVLPEITPDASAIEVLGTTDRTMGFWTASTNSVEIADGESKTIVFNNYSDGAANWDNYLVAFANTAITSDKLPSADNYEGYAEYAVVRADLFGWGDASYAAAFEGSWGDDWATFANMMTAAKVTLTISRSGSDVTIDAVINGADGVEYTSKSVITSTLTSDAPCHFFLVGEKVYIEVLSVE